MGCGMSCSIFSKTPIDIDFTLKRQYIYMVNNMKELFEYVKVDKILTFLRAVGLYKRI